MGVSTGGPNALSDFLPGFPAECPVPIVIVQHMPPKFTAQLAQRLASRSKIKVVEAAEGMVLQPGYAYIAPGDYHITIDHRADKSIIRTNQNPPENSCRPAVDVLFRSVAEEYGGSALAIIMTGMGQDGMLGCQQLKQVGCRILIQDKETSVVWGMPGAVSAAGLANETLPLMQLSSRAMEILKKCR